MEHALIIGGMFFYLLGLDIIGQQQGDVWSYFGYDGLGSVRQVYDNLGAVGYATSYAPYGDRFEQYGTLTTNLGFTGEYTDASGLLYLRARYLNTDLGMFLTKDPFEGVINRVMSRNGYSYVEGNVINLTDPSGEVAQWLIGAIIGGAIGASTAAIVAARLWDMSNGGECGCEAEQWAKRTDRTGFILKTTAIGAAIGAATGVLATTPAAPFVAGGGTMLSLDMWFKAEAALRAGDTSMCTKLLRDLGLIGFVTGALGVMGGVSGSITPSGLAPVTNTGYAFARGTTVALSIDASGASGAAIFGGVSYFANHDPDGPYGNGEPDTTRVGRWMSRREYNSMKSTGRVQESEEGGGVTYVLLNGPDEFRREAPPGSVYVEFDIPADAPLQVTESNRGWARILGPNSLFGRAWGERTGIPITEMPQASNITLVEVK